MQQFVLILLITFAPFIKRRTKKIRKTRATTRFYKFYIHQSRSDLKHKRSMLKKEKKTNSCSFVDTLEI